MPKGQFYINGSSLETTGLNNLSVYNPGSLPVSTTWYNWQNSSETQNFTIVGNPTITNKIVSGFASVNYLTIPSFDTETATSWEINLVLNYTFNNRYIQVIMQNPNKFMLQTTSVARLAFNKRINNSWVYQTDSPEFGSGKYWIKLLFTGSAYQLLVSTTGDNYTVFDTYTSSDKIINTSDVIRIGCGTNNLYIKDGSIELDYCNIKVNNNVIWTPYIQSQVFTNTETPTTSSTVYSAPNTASELTITSVDTGTITCSDNNTYNRNSEGDIVTS